MIRVTLLAACLLACIAPIYGDNACPIYTNPITKLNYDLSPMAEFFTHVDQTNHEYLIGMCEGTDYSHSASCCPKSSAGVSFGACRCQYPGSASITGQTSLGNFSTFTFNPYLMNSVLDGVTISYTNGSSCPNGKLYSSRANILCDESGGADQLYSVVDDPTNCIVNYTIFSIHGCGYRGALVKVPRNFQGPAFASGDLSGFWPQPNEPINGTFAFNLNLNAYSLQGYSYGDSTKKSIGIVSVVEGDDYPVQGYLVGKRENSVTCDFSFYPNTVNKCQTFLLQIQYKTIIFNPGQLIYVFVYSCVGTIDTIYIESTTGNPVLLAKTSGTKQFFMEMDWQKVVQQANSSLFTVPPAWNCYLPLP